MRGDPLRTPWARDAALVVGAVTVLGLLLLGFSLLLAHLLLHLVSGMRPG